MPDFESLMAWFTQVSASSRFFFWSSSAEPSVSHATYRLGSVLVASLANFSASSGRWRRRSTSARSFCAAASGRSALTERRRNVSAMLYSPALRRSDPIT